MGIGASAGGLEAFSELLAALPVDAPAAYVLVQHLDPTHRSLLTELLGKKATLPVREIVDGTPVEAGQIYVIPPNSDLTISGGILRLSPRRKNSGAARSIDTFLNSLAEDQGENAIAVILSGAASDGAKGLRAVKEAGGITFAQEEKTARYDSMPRSAIATGGVDFILPPAKIAHEIARVVSRPGFVRSRVAANARARSRVPEAARRALHPAAGSAEAQSWPVQPRDLQLRKIFLLLRGRTGVDFSLYRPTTVNRRLQRRLAANKLRSLEGYVRVLRENPAEIDTLYQDLLIGVTRFFRNPALFDVLKRKVFPRLVRDSGHGDCLRAWVVGCSTGQEAYSIAMAYTEFAEQAQVHVPLQIFATDINATALNHARAGRYTAAQVEHVRARRLSRFFTEERGGGWRVAKSIRDMVVFAQQNVLSDPPFTRVDLISCRNMLIYLEPALQQKVLPTFHYALRPKGCLVLGSSESAASFPALYEPLDRRNRIFFRRTTATRTLLDRPQPIAGARQATSAPVAPRAPEPTPKEIFQEADRVTLSQFGPAAVVVNDQGEVLQFRGDVQRYLELPAGKATFSLQKMARGGLGLILQRAIERARKENRIARERGIRVEGRAGRVDLTVVPLKNLRGRPLLVWFEPPARAASPPVERPPAGPRGRAKDARLAGELRRELAEARDQLGLLREQHDTSVEELQASNEEVQSANEELQSLNEELETSNEELESANEELTTLNEELATRNNELRESEQQLREQAQLLEMAPLLARNAKDRIVYWTKGAEALYGFTAEEAVGQAAHLLLSAEYERPYAQIMAELARSGRWSGEVWHRRKDGQRLCVATRWIFHSDAERRTRTILEVHADITQRKAAEDALRDSEEFNRRILQSSPDCIKLLDLEGRLVFMSPGGQDAMELADFDTTVANSYWPGIWEAESRAEAERAFHRAVTGDTSRFRGLHRTGRGVLKWWDVVVRPVLGAAGKPTKILAVARDITQAKREEAQRELQAHLALLRAGIAFETARDEEPAVVLQEVAAIILRQTDISWVGISMCRPGDEGQRMVAMQGRRPWHAGARGAAGANPLDLQPFSELKEPLLLDSEGTGGLAMPAWAREKGAGAMGIFPLLTNARAVGALVLLSERPMSRELASEIRLSSEAIGHYIERCNNEEERKRLLQDAMAARNEALAASRAKDDFLATLSHELRTPLNPILLLASEEATNPDLVAETRSVFETIRNNATTEARLIDDLLDLTRITHGKLSLNLARVDVHVLLREALAIVEPEIARKRLDLASEFRAARSTVQGDAVRLQQVLWNILINAAKFTPAGGRISVETFIRAGEEDITVSVSDSGIGIAPGEVERIFAPFLQAEHRAGGLGLGLAISRELVDRHGGRIRAMSPGLGKGSVFELSLPLCTTEPPVPASRIALAPAQA